MGLYIPGEPNPFDALDNVQPEGENLTPAPPPSLWERFQVNKEAGYYTGTLGGAFQGTGPESYSRERALSRYESLPQWETPAEGAAALAGQLASQFNPFAAPENFTPIGLGEKAVAWMGVKAATRARIMAGAIDAGAVNAVTDPAIQGMEIGSGTRQSYDPVQTASSIALGMVPGGVGGPLTHAHIGARPEAKAAPAPSVEAPAAKLSITPETFRGDNAPALKIGNEIFTGETHAEALGKAVEQFGTNSPQIKSFAEEGDPLNSIGLYDQKRGFIPDISGDKGKDVVAAAKEAMTAEPIVSRETTSEPQPEPAPFTIGEALDQQARQHRDLPPRAEAAPAELAASPKGGLANAPQRSQAGAPTTTHAAAPATTRLMDVSNKLVDELQAVVRQGRISNPKALGIYKIASGTVRVRKPDDFDVLTHELGHHLEEHVGTPLKQAMKQFKAELIPMAYRGAKKGSELKEGFAEYVRLALTNPAYARNAAPSFDQAFRAAMASPEYANLGKAMDEASSAYRDWLQQPSAQAVRSTIVSSKEPSGIAKAKAKLDRYGLGHTIADFLSRAYAMTHDDLNPLSRAVRALAYVYKDNFGKLLNLEVASDPYKLARMSRGAWSAGHVDITDGIHPYRSTKPASPSLRDAIILAMAKPNVLSHWDNEMAARFGGYLWSRRALGEWDRFDQGLIPNTPDKLTKGDHAINIQEMEAAHPQFRQAADMVHQWAQALWEKKRDAGLITHEEWNDGLAIRDYVPGQRAFDQDYDPLAKGAGPKGSVKGGFVKRFQGSRRDVINPVESLIRDAYETSMAIARNDVVKTLGQLADLAGPGSGHIAERVPAKEIRGTMIDPLEAVESAAKASGMAKQDIVALRDAVESQIGDAKAAIFRPAIINEKGEPIVFYRNGGQIQALRLADGRFGLDMYRAITGMTQMQQNIWINSLAKVAGVFRLGIVSDPTFIVSNFIRDQGMAYILYGGALKNLIGTVRGMGEDLFAADAAREYNHAYGLMGGSGVASLHEVRVNRDISELKKQGWVGSRLTSLEGILSLTEISETGARLSLFRRFKDEALKRGLSQYEALMEASWRARDYVDYNRHGSQMMSLSRLIPFFNAGLQGTDKAVRHMIAPLARYATGRIAMTEDSRAAGDAVKSWARLSGLTMLGMGLYAMNSEHDEFRDMNPQTKGSNWWFKLGGKWLGIPKPFEMAAITNLGEAAWNAMAKRDPRWKDEYLQGLMQAVLPPNLLEGNPVIKTAYELKTNTDLYTGQQIVPDELQGMEPWLQYTARTSELARQLGKAFNEPPVLIDHLIANQAGSYGRNLLALYDWALSDKPTPGWADMPFTRRFIKDASRGSSSSRAFWDMASERTGTMEGALRSWKAMEDAGDVVNANNYLAKQDDNTKVWIAASQIDSSAKSLHPLIRARHAVQAIAALRRDLMDGNIQTADGTVAVPRIERGAADDILSDLSMTEMRNALVVMGEPGWKGRDIIDNTTYHRELEAVSAPIAKALADHYASAGTKVVPFDTMQELWPDLEQRLKEDGSQAMVRDLSAIVRNIGPELEGTKIKRTKPIVPALVSQQ